jgi:hypothetical protein
MNSSVGQNPNFAFFNSLFFVIYGKHDRNIDATIIAQCAPTKPICYLSPWKERKLCTRVLRSKQKQIVLNLKESFPESAFIRVCSLRLCVPPPTPIYKRFKLFFLIIFVLFIDLFVASVLLRSLSALLLLLLLLCEEFCNTRVSSIFDCVPDDDAAAVTD